MQPYEMTTCSLCSLGPASRLIRCTGDPASPIVLVGEAPASDELKEGAVFQGRSGQLLRYALGLSGLDRYDPFITNTVKCFSKGNPSLAQADTCADHYLKRELEAYPRKLVVALGGMAHRVLGSSEDRITKRVGTIVPFRDYRVMYTIHPASALYRESNWDLLYYTLVRAREFVDGDYVVPGEPRTVLVSDPKEAVSVIAAMRAAPAFAVDIESDGFDWLTGSLLGLSLSCSEEVGYWLPWSVLCHAKVRRALTLLLGDPGVTKIMHNAKFDCHWLGRYFTRVADPVVDTMVMAHLTDENLPMGLKAQAVLRGVAPRRWDDELEDTKAYANLPETVLGTYAAFDAVYTFRLYQHFQAGNLEKRPIYSVVHSAVRLTEQMEERGILVDQTALGVVADVSEKMHDDMLAALRSETGNPDFNPRSNPQIQKYLYGTLGAAPVKVTEKTGSPSADKESLQTIALSQGAYDSHTVDFCRYLLTYRRAHRLLSTYAKAIRGSLGHDGAARPSYNLTVAITGRLSSSKPFNIQNQPKIVRPMFVARPGYKFIDLDFKQAEVRVWAAYSKDPVLIDFILRGDADTQRFEDEKAAGVENPDPPLDMHRMIASIANEVAPADVTDAMRTDAKRTTFGLMYGKVLDTFIRDFDGDEEKAKRLYDAVFGTFKVATKWLEKTKRRAVDKGVLWTPMGRARHLPGARMVRSPVWDCRRFGERLMRQAVNSPIQALASDLNLQAMVDANAHFEAAWVDCYPLITVHDSQIWECADSQVEEAMAVIRGICAGLDERYDLGVPMAVDMAVVDRWAGTISAEKIADYISDIKLPDEQEFDDADG